MKSNVHQMKNTRQVPVIPTQIIPPSKQMAALDYLCVPLVFSEEDIMETLEKVKKLEEFEGEFEISYECRVPHVNAFQNESEFCYKLLAKLIQKTRPWKITFFFQDDPVTRKRIRPSFYLLFNPGTKLCLHCFQKYPIMLYSCVFAVRISQYLTGFDAYRFKDTTIDPKLEIAIWLKQYVHFRLNALLYFGAESLDPLNDYSLNLEQGIIVAKTLRKYVFPHIPIHPGNLIYDLFTKD